MISGIYKLYNTANGKFYIGSSQNVKARIKGHLRDLKKDKHGNRHLQFSYNKYGNVFDYEILEECRIEVLIEREQFYIDYFKPDYNLHLIAGSPKGYKHSENAKKRIASFQTGRIKSTETCEKISKSKQGHIVSEQTKNKISSTLKNKQLSYSKPVKMISIQTGEEYAFNSVSAAARFISIKNPISIYKCCNEEIESYKGYKWKWIITT